MGREGWGERTDGERGGVGRGERWGEGAGGEGGAGRGKGKGFDRAFAMASSNSVSTRKLRSDCAA